MKKLGLRGNHFVVTIIATIVSITTTAIVGQSRSTIQPVDAKASPDSNSSNPNPFSGSWTYRSFVGDPNLATQPNDLLFGRGTLALNVLRPDTLGGTLGGEDWQLTLRGGVTSGNPATIRFQGIGIIDGEEWIYDYLGYLVPVWPNGVNQRPAIVGTIVRTKPHSNGSGGTSSAGVVAQWIAVKQDETASVSNGAAAKIDSSIRDSTGLIYRNPPDVHPPFGDLYSHGVEVPSGYRTLYIAGQAGVTRSGAIPADSDAQLDLVWGNIKQVLAASDMTVNDLIKVTCFLKDEKYEEAFAKSVLRHLGTAKPAMSAPIVRQLWSNEWYFEVEAIAAKREGRGSPASAEIARPQRAAGDAQPPRGGEAAAPGIPNVTAPAVTDAEDSRRALNQLREMYRRQDAVERARERSQKEVPTDRPLTPMSVRPSAASPSPIRAAGPAKSTKSSLTPLTVSSTRKGLDLTLDLNYHQFHIGKDDVVLRSYNGQLVAPVMKCKAGDTLYITLNNRLPPNAVLPHSSEYLNGHHDWNTTNLHFHGLHVAPQGPSDLPGGRSSAESDNVLLELPPSKPFDPKVSSQNYAVHIPPNHPAGTFWYHAHKHGAVAGQVSSGLAGALIVERDDDTTNLDSIAEIKAAAQEIMVLQQIPYTSNVFGHAGGIEPTSDIGINNIFGPTQWPTLGRYTLVNGLRIPTITIAPGELRRLRVIHAGQREAIKLQIEPDAETAGKRVPIPSVFEVALDGLATGRLDEMKLNGDPSDPKRELELFPGYRLDLLLQPPVEGAGTFYLVDANVPGNVHGCDGSPEPVRRIATIVVAGEPIAMDLPNPTALRMRRPSDIDPATVMGTQFAFYGIDITTNPISFLISQENLNSPPRPVVPNSNAYPYTKGRPRELQLNSVDRWYIGSRNAPPAPGGPPLQVTHPFHIHTNPFFIKRVTDADQSDVTVAECGGPVWRDTLAMKQGYTYELLTQYSDFSGSFVDHCHILDHEDRGMMELVTIGAQTSKAAKAESPPNRIGTTLVEARGQPSLLLFVKGAYCQHCMAQLTEMAATMSQKDVAVSVVSASTLDDLREFPAVPFSLVADPELQLFRKYGAFTDEAKHATICLNARGDEVFRDVGDVPLMDAQKIMAALKLSPAGEPSR